MRTTINLPDALAEAAKAKAAAEERTFTSVVEEGLRNVVAIRPSERSPLRDCPSPAPPATGPSSTSTIREALWQALDADGPR